MNLRQASARRETNRGRRLQIPWHLTVGPDSQHQDERQDNIGVYQKSQEVV